MARKFGKPRRAKEPDGSMDIYCPYCDWHLVDSFSSRRRMGSHIANDHYGEIAVPHGTEPANLEPK